MGDMTVNKIVHRAKWAAVAVVGAAFAVGAQGPPLPGDFRGPGFGHGRIMEGSFEFGGLVGAFGGKTIAGKPFQATFTITHTETLPGNTINNTTTGTIARDIDGSTYRDVKLPAIGPLAASGQTPELVYIRNVTKMMQYFVNVATKTYEAITISPQNSSAPGSNPPDRGPKGSVSANEAVND